MPEQNGKAVVEQAPMKIGISYQNRECSSIQIWGTVVYSPAEVYLQGMLTEKIFEEARGEKSFSVRELGCIRELFTTMRSSAAGFLPGP